MNILEVQKALTNLDDNALKQEMLSPGVAPQFLVLSEMQRRQEIRNGGKAPPAGPRPSMKDEALGIGSLPQAQGMPQAMPPGGPPAGMPSGTPPSMGPGMQPAPSQAGAEPQAFAAGGAVVLNGQIVYPEDYDQDPDGALRAYRPRADWTFGATPPSRRTAAPQGVPIAPGSLGAQGLGDGSPMYFPVSALAPDEAPLRVGPAGGPSITPEQADYPAGPATTVRQSGPAAASTNPANGGLRSLAAGRALAPPASMYGRNAGRVIERDASLLGTDADRANRSAQVAADSGLPSLPGGYREPSATRSEGGAWTAGLTPASGVVNGSIGTAVASRNVAPPGTGAAAVAGDSSSPIVVQRPDSTGGNSQGGRFRDNYREAAGIVPDRYAGMDEEARALFGRDASEARGQAGAFALMDAGLRMMGSRDTRFLGAAAEGGLAGLQSYRQGLTEAKKAEREGFSARLGLAGARSQQDAGILKVAGDLYGSDAQDRRSDATNRTSLAVAQLGSNTQLATTGMNNETTRSTALLGARTQLDIADLNAKVQRETRERQEAVQRYVADNPANWTTIKNIMEMPEGPMKDRAWQSITSPGYGAAGTNQARVQYFQQRNLIEDDAKLTGLERPEERRAKMETYRRRLQQLDAAYPEYSGQPAAGAAAPAAPADPLGLRGGR